MKKFKIFSVILGFGMIITGNAYGYVSYYHLTTNTPNTTIYVTVKPVASDPWYCSAGGGQYPISTNNNPIVASSTDCSFTVAYTTNSDYSNSQVCQGGASFATPFTATVNPGSCVVTTSSK